MGLGKTVQISVYVGCLMRINKLSKLMIVVPSTLMEYWYRELTHWNPRDNLDIINLFQCQFLRRKQLICERRNKPTIVLISPKLFINDIVCLN